MRLFKEEKDFIRTEVKNSIHDEVRQQQEDTKNEGKELLKKTKFFKDVQKIANQLNGKEVNMDVSLWNYDEVEVETAYGQNLPFRVEVKKILDHGIDSLDEFSWYDDFDSILTKVSLGVKCPSDDERYSTILNIIESVKKSIRETVKARCGQYLNGIRSANI